jgi:hypothetical protein
MLGLPQGMAPVDRGSGARGRGGPAASAHASHRTHWTVSEDEWALAQARSAEIIERA